MICINLNYIKHSILYKCSVFVHIFLLLSSAAQQRLDKETPSPCFSPIESRKRRRLLHEICHHVTLQLHFQPEQVQQLRTISPFQHGDTSHRPGEAQADQHQRDCGSGECCRAEEGLQSTPAFHSGERQKHCNSQGLLLCPGSHCERSPGWEVDQNTAVLLWGRPKGKD